METIRSYPNEPIILATLGLQSCVSIGLEGNGRKSLTHLANGNRSFGNEKEDYSFGQKDDIIALIKREKAWIGDGKVTIHIAYGTNEDKKIQETGSVFAETVKEIISSEFSMKNIPVTLCHNGKYSFNHIKPPADTKMDWGTNFVERGNGNLWLMALRKIIDGSDLPQVAYDNGWKQPLISKEVRKAIVEYIAEKPGVMSALAKKTQVSDTAYVAKKLAEDAENYLQSITQQAKAALKTLAGLLVSTRTPAKGR